MDSAFNGGFTIEHFLKRRALLARVNRSINYYELHITIEGGDKKFVKDCVEGVGWKFSAIDGDPVMGSGVKLYATKHLPANCIQLVVLNALDATAAELKDAGCVILRSKIEMVLFDSFARPNQAAN